MVTVYQARTRKPSLEDIYRVRLLDRRGERGARNTDRRWTMRDKLALRIKELHIP
jgi:hypothetical protein